MLALSHIHKSLNGNTILRDTTLHIQEGAINCLLGPSGCGKSTLLRVAAGLLSPEHGTVHLDPSHCAMVFQEPRLLPWLTVAENLALALPFTPSRTKTQHPKLISQALQRMQLDGIESYMPRELSGGMAQRIGIARALLRQPKMLLMDEPFAALDAITRTTLQHVLIELIEEQHTTCLFVTHDIDETIAIGNQISIMHHGTITHQVNNHQKHPHLKQQIFQYLHPLKENTP